MEQATDAEKGMTVSEFLDFKRRNKVCFYPMASLSVADLQFTTLLCTVPTEYSFLKGKRGLPNHIYLDLILILL